MHACMLIAIATNIRMTDGIYRNVYGQIKPLPEMSGHACRTVKPETLTNLANRDQIAKL